MQIENPRESKKDNTKKDNTKKEPERRQMQPTVSFVEKDYTLLLFSQIFERKVLFKCLREKKLFPKIHIKNSKYL